MHSISPFLKALFQQIHCANTFKKPLATLWFVYIKLKKLFFLFSPLLSRNPWPVRPSKRREGTAEKWAHPTRQVHLPPISLFFSLCDLSAAIIVGKGRSGKRRNPRRRTNGSHHKHTLSGGGGGGGGKRDEILDISEEEKVGFRWWRRIGWKLLISLFLLLTPFSLFLPLHSRLPCADWSFRLQDCEGRGKTEEEEWWKKEEREIMSSETGFNTTSTLHVQGRKWNDFRLISSRVQKSVFFGSLRAFAVRFCFTFLYLPLTKIERLYRLVPPPEALVHAALIASHAGLGILKSN